MSVLISNINPIRLFPSYDSSYGGMVTIDYDNLFPQPDIMQVGINYQKGIEPMQNYKTDWLVNAPLVFQVRFSDIPTILSAKLYHKYGTTGIDKNLTVTDITPIGWVGYKIRKFSIKPTQAGAFFIYLNFQVVADTFTFISDEILFTDTQSEDKTIIKVEFFNSFNDFDFIFDDYYTVFYTGQFKPIAPETEITSFETDTPSLIASKSFGQMELKICDIPNLYIDQISHQFLCDYIKVNGKEYISKNGIEISETNKSDSVDIDITLTSKHNIKSKFYY